jgi:hypothetical protein
MVFAVQCPNPQCRKYQLVEDHDRNKIVYCLLCKTGIKIGGPVAPGQSKMTSGNPQPKPKP